MEPKPKKVFLALPTYANQMRKDFVLSLLDALLFKPVKGVEFTLGTIGGDGVARARNNLTQSFLLSSECDIIVYIDVDIVFTRDQLERLVSLVTPERPIVGGLYAAKQLSHRWIMTALQDEGPDADGLQRVKEVGTGFKAYHRSYFDKVRDAFPEIQYFCDGDPARKLVKWDFFSMGVVDGRYLSEDYYADYRAAKIGIPVYVDTTCLLKHEGAFQYPLMSNMNITDKIPASTVFKIAEVLGLPGHHAHSHEEVQIAARLISAA